MYYKKSRHNFFKNIFSNKMTKYYFIILLVFLVLIGFTASYVITHYNEDAQNENPTDATENVSTQETVSETPSTAPEASTPTAPTIEYTIRINKATNLAYVYEKDLALGTTTLIRCFACSVPEGAELSENYSVSEKYVWKPINDKYYSQYATRISSSLSIQSIPFRGPNKDDIVGSYYENLEEPSKDANCIYMLVGDAFWIYNNCPSNTSVVVYSTENETLELTPNYRPKLVWCVKWDPTDPDTNNKWCQTKLGKMSRITNKTITVGTYFNPYNGVTAVDENGNDITSKIVVDGEVDVNTPGKYAITYVLVDIYGNDIMRESIITVVPKESTAQ